MGRRVAAVGIAVATSACSVLTVPGGDGSASPEAADSLPTDGAAASPDAAARSFVDAWVAGDRAAGDRLANGRAEGLLFGRPPPVAPPELVTCGSDSAVAGADDCLFTVDDDFLLVTVRPHPSEDGWRVVAVRAMP